LVGIHTWVVVSAVEQEQNIKPFFDAVKQIFIKSIEKMMKKFLFGDSLLRDLEILKPKKLASSTIDVVIGLANKFSQLKLSDDYSSFDKLSEECLDCILSSTDISNAEELQLEKYVTIGGK